LPPPLVPFLFLSICNPDIDPVDDQLAITNQIMLILTLVGALMIKFDQGFHATGVYEAGYSMDVVQGMLIASASMVFIGGFGSAMWSTMAIVMRTRGSPSIGGGGNAEANNTSVAVADQGVDGRASVEADLAKSTKHRLVI
jgi:hypothetical protein